MVSLDQYGTGNEAEASKDNWEVHVSTIKTNERMTVNMYKSWKIIYTTKIKRYIKERNDPLRIFYEIFEESITPAKCFG